MKKILLSLLFPLSLQAQTYSPYLSAVDEYCPAPGQFVNTMPAASSDDTPLTMAQKCTAALADNRGELVCLGAFGGYITFHFDHPIVNINGAYDLRMYGNAYAGNAEPGIVMVSQDTNGNGLPDDRWYELAGSADHDSIGKVIYGYEITYTKAAMQDIPWSDNLGNHGTVDRNSSHLQEYFPLWIDAETISFRGTKLPPNAHDISGVGTYYMLDALDYGYVDNKANTDAEGNSFNIDWAVDEDRNPVALTHIDFVRVYSAQNQKCGWIGETSTEFAGCEDLHLQASIDYAADIKKPQDSTTTSKTITAIYSPDGKLLKSPSKGICIVKYTDGTITKVLK